MFTDSHCHIHFIDEIPNHEVVQNALNNKVTTMLCVATDLSQMNIINDLTNKYDGVFGSAGIHPSDAHEYPISNDNLIKAAENKKIIAIGETGLDYYRGDEHKDVQKKQFVSHISVAKELKKPLIIHTRSAQKDTIDIMKKEKASDAGGVMHCFTETWEMAKQALDLNFYISISGIVTFKNAGNVKEVAEKTPIDRLLIETDAPFLAPVPFRGKTNQPSYVVKVAEFIAELKNITVEEVARKTTSNFYKMVQLELKN